MIVGLGIDIVEVARIAEAMKNPRFIERILTPIEREFCTTPQKVAGRWAAKEAIAKAVGLQRHNAGMTSKFCPMRWDSRGPAWRQNISIPNGSG